MRAKTRVLMILAGLAAMAACGGGPSGGGALSVKIISAKSFNPNVQHGRIERYVVTIEGERIEPPIEATFPGDATEGIIDGVPVGEGRTVRVSAINPNDAAIRAGETEGVTVTDELTSVAVGMQAVPIFTNIADGAIIDNTRVVFHLFSDPADALVIEEGSGDAAVALVDAAANSAEIHLDASTGLGRLSPALMAPGAYRFSVRDLVTGRRSTAAVRLLDGTKRRPAPLVAAGAGAGRATAAAGGAIHQR